MKKAIDEYSNSNKIYSVDTLPRKLFVNLMRNAIALVGNSSMGILEAPFYRLPVINIGNRQKGRLNAGNVQFVTYNETQILAHLEKACMDMSYRDEISKIVNPFGNEHSAENIRRVIESIDIDDQKWHVKTKLC